MRALKYVLVNWQEGSGSWALLLSLRTRGATRLCLAGWFKKVALHGSSLLKIGPQ